MDDIPTPRRYRGRDSTGSSFPLIPILLGVIVLGLAFGAGLSVLLQRNSSSPLAIATATPAPVPSPAPRATRTGAQLNAIRRSPPPHVSPAPVAVVPSPRPSASPGMRRVAIVASPIVIGPVGTPAPRLRTAAPPLATAAPRLQTAAPAPATAAPQLQTVAPRLAAAAPTDEADSEFARLSAGVVRFYLSALARGDDASARTVLDGPRGSPALRLSEKEFADPSLRIVKLDAHGISDSATVNVDLSSSKGAYFEQFSLRRLPTGAAVIIEHTFVRP